MDNLREPEADTHLPAMEIKIADDKMTVFMSCPSAYVDNSSIYDEIVAAFKQAGIPRIPNLEQIQQSLKQIPETSEYIQDWPLLKGIPPVESVDGRLEWQGDYFHTGYQIDPVTNRIDFRQRAGNPNVEKGQLLVRVVRACPGKDGYDALGNKITVRRPREAELKGGPNVYWDPDQNGYVANSSGRVKLKGKTLDIDPVYFVPNGVGIESGNINHNGPVVIDGEVESEFKVEAAGDIEIRGLTYASDIVCGGNLTAKEGINSHPEKLLNVVGDIYAKYIQNANLSAGGNIIVNTEIFQCNLKTKGEVICKSGRIIGGEVLATKGITVGEAGSKGNVKTVLIAGLDKELKNKRNENCTEINRLKETVKKLDTVIRNLKANQHLLTNAQKETMTEIQFKISEGEIEIERLEEENRRMHEIILVNSRARIIILEVAHPGVNIRINESHYKIDHALAGPIVASLSPITGEVVLSSELENKDGEENESREH
nr:DUF342 domain-containing protein [candidate division Zixibacteria bacterium]